MENKLSDIYQALIGDSIIYGIDGSSGPNVDYKNPIQHTMNQGNLNDTYLFKETIATVNGLCIIHYQSPKAATNNIYWYVSVNGVVIYLLPLSRAGAYYSSFPVKNGDAIRLFYPSSIGINEANSSIIVCPYLSDTYSEEEKVIGLWIDGKPIYRKVIKTTGPEKVGEIKNIDVSALNIDTVVNFDGYYFWSSTKSTVKIITAAENGNVSRMHVNGDYVVLSNTIPGWVNGEATIFLEYTKTTD